MNLSGKEASYSITIAAKKLGISKHMLREYEKSGLLKPFRDPANGRSLFFNNDLKWIRHIRQLIHSERVNIASIQRLLAIIPCWKTKSCPKSKKESCVISVDHTRPCWTTVSKTSMNKCWSCKVYLEAQRRLS